MAVAVRVRLPLVPVIVSDGLPTGVPAVDEIVRVVLPLPVTDVGLNDAEAPAGSPDALKPTVPANPFAGVMATLNVVELPAVIVRDAGVADTEKSGAGAWPPAGTICTALMGERGTSLVAPGVAVIVKLDPVIGNLTKLPAEPAACTNVPEKLACAASVRLMVAVVMPGPLIW